MLRNESSVSSSSWLWLGLTPMLMCLSGGPKTSGHYRPASRPAIQLPSENVAFQNPSKAEKE
jgi:hypothetical protein